MAKRRNAVIFPQTLDPQSLQAEDFKVTTRSGAQKTPACVTLRPALDIGESRTVLLIGDFGHADTIHLRLSRLWMTCFQVVQRKAK